MKKRKLNLSLKLNKQVISKLDEKRTLGGLVGGGGISVDDDWPDCPYSDWICFKTDHCTAGGPSICDQQFG